MARYGTGARPATDSRQIEPLRGTVRHQAMASLFLLLGLVISGLIVGPAQAQDEEQYFRDMGSLIAAAEVHLGEAAEAILTCAASLAQCIANPTSITTKLNASRDGLDGLRSTVLALTVPDRYRAAHDLIAQGLNDSIAGIDLFVEGILTPSDTKILAGADLFSDGLSKIAEGERLLAQSPPTSPLVELLIIVVVALGASVTVSVVLILWWVRRMRLGRLKEPPGP
ncbi:MAG: hypothetical protein V3W28_03260 [Thermoplasmata archaeon]